MNQKIKISVGIKYCIMGIAILVFLLVWPFGVIHRTEVSKSDEVILQVSDPISVEHNGTQMFIAEGNYLKSVKLYVSNDMQGEIITFRVYDGAYKQLWETFYTVDEKATFPGFIKIDIEMETQEGLEYYYTVEGLTKDLELYYEDTNASTSFANGTYLYGGEEMPGINLIIRYVYTKNFVWWAVLLWALALLIFSKGACVIVDFCFKTKAKEKEITLQKLIQTVANPIVAAGTLCMLFLIFPGKVFGVGAVNYGFYYIGIAVIAFFLFYGINYKRKTMEPLITKNVIKAEWTNWLMAMAFAKVLWSCYEYLNGLYNIHHSYAACKMLTWFGIVLLCTFGKEYLWKVWNLVYLAGALVFRYFYIRPYLGMEEQEELYRLQAWVIIVGVFLIIQILISLGRIFTKKEKVNAKICLPYACLLGVWMVLMVAFRNKRAWIVLMAVMFGVFYYCIWRWKEREKLLAVFCNGVILNFLYMVMYCLMHRPYLRFRHNRFGMGFHTVTMTGYYLALVTAAIMVKLLIRYRKNRRWMDCYKELGLLGVANAYLFLTLSRTGYLAAVLMQLFMLVFVSCVWEKKKLLGILTTASLAAGSVIVAFPAVFTAQRILPAICNDPIYSEVEVWEYVIEKGDKMDSELYIDITAFMKVMGNKLFGMETGNISLSSVKERIREEAQYLCLTANPVYVKKDLYLLASEADMYEKTDISNGRFEIFKSYIQYWNMTGHEEMGVPLEDGTIAVHAHNTYLQMIHDNGILTGLVFVLLGVVSFFMALIRYQREKREDSYLLLTIAVIIAFASAGMVEWIFQICNFFGIAILVVITPLLFKQTES